MTACHCACSSGVLAPPRHARHHLARAAPGLRLPAAPAAPQSAAPSARLTTQPAPPQVLHQVAPVLHERERLSAQLAAAAQPPSMVVSHLSAAWLQSLTVHEQPPANLLRANNPNTEM